MLNGRIGRMKEGLKREREWGDALSATAPLADGWPDSHQQGVSKDFMIIYVG